MDLSNFLKASVAGVPLVFVIIGLVEWCKRFKRADGSQAINGNWLLLISMILGLVLGGGFMISQTRPPIGDWWTSFVYWFALLVYGLAMGIVGSGLYTAVKGMVEGQFVKLFERIK